MKILIIAFLALLLFASMSCYAYVTYHLVKGQLNNNRCEDCPHLDDCAMVLLHGMRKFCDLIKPIAKNQITPQL